MLRYSSFENIRDTIARLEDSVSHLEEEVRSLEKANAEATKLNVEVQHLSDEVRTAHTKCKENEGMLEEIAEENEQLELLADKRSPTLIGTYTLPCRALVRRCRGTSTNENERAWRG